MHKFHELYQHFLSYPYLSAFLAFDDHNFSGIILKKDIEQQLRTQQLDVEELIISTSCKNIEQLIFNQDPKSTMHIPYIDLQGNIVDTLLYSEFVSEFYTEDFSNKLSIKEILDYMDHPVLILNRFKTILYLNKHAEELISCTAFGQKVGSTLKNFELFIHNEELYLENDDQFWLVQISQSYTQSANYYVYQFFPQKNTP